MRVASPADEPAVVGDQDDRAFVGLQPLDEGLDRLQVEVVRGLVEDQHVGLVHGQPAKHEARGLAAGEVAQALLHVVAGEQHQPEVAAHEADGLVGAGLPRPALGGAAGGWKRSRWSWAKYPGWVS